MYMNRLENMLIGFWAFVPFVHLPLVVLQLVRGAERVSSFTGNPILLAGQSIFSFFVALWCFKRYGDQMYIWSACLSALYVVWSFTHASWLGMLVAGIVSIPLLYVPSKRKAR